ncbi:M48 family metallopeptidase [Desulfocurvus sp. DL9XJH121]
MAEPYTVRESARARRVTLRVSPRRGVEVVVPRGFDRAAVPGIVARREGWIEAQVQRLRDKGWSESPPGRPEVLPLRALGREVRLEAVHAAGRATALTPRGPDRLLLSGDTEDHAAGRVLVLAWLKTQARLHLVPRLRELSARHGLPFAGAQVRAQASRWGSCSARGAISLNCKLCFLPPELAEHVLLHELAHLRHLDHSPDFHAFLHRLDPESAARSRALADAWHHVPGWLD